MSWRTIYITQCEKISLYLDNLLIVKDATEYKIPSIKGLELYEL